jgi:hypothetical protein
MGQYFDFRPGYLKNKPGDDFAVGGGGQKGGLRGQTQGGDVVEPGSPEDQWYKLGQTLAHPVQTLKNTTQSKVVQPAQGAWKSFKAGMQSGVGAGGAAGAAGGAGAAAGMGY